MDAGNFTVFVQVAAAIGAAVAAYFSRAGKKHAKVAAHESAMTNDAVNNVHEASGQPRIYDLALQNAAAIAALSETNSAVHDAVMTELQAIVPRGLGDRRLYDKIEALERRLEEHDRWERSTKYSEIEREIRQIKETE